MNINFFKIIPVFLLFFLATCASQPTDVSSTATTTGSDETETETETEIEVEEESSAESSTEDDVVENSTTDAIETDPEVGATESGSAVTTITTPQDLSACAMDIHLHFNSNIAFSEGATLLQEKMKTLQIGDFVGLNFALLEPPPAPCPSCSSSQYTYEDDKNPSLETIIDTNPTRFGLIAGGGELSPIIHEAARNKTTPSADELLVFRQSAEAIIDDGALGFGEMAALHLSFTDEHPFIEIPADHAYFLVLADVAAERDVPLDIHIEAVNQESYTFLEDMPSSCFKTVAKGGNNPATLKENISAFKTLLSRNYDTALAEGDASKAKIVWSHVGWDNTGDLTAILVRELMAAHPNLYASLKMLDTAGPCQVIANRPLDENGDLQDEWKQLFVDYPDRFVLGADDFTGNDASITAESPSLQGTWNLIGKLSDDLAYKFACENPRRIYEME